MSIVVGRSLYLVCLFIVAVHAITHDEAVFEYNRIRKGLANYRSLKEDLGVQELFKLISATDCKRHPFSQHCYPGTVKFDPWIAESIRFQTHILARDIPLDRAQFTFTHNSFNDRSGKHISVKILKI
jgi:hypothetical protein